MSANRIFAAVAGMGLFLGSAIVLAQADSFPTKPIMVVVPFPPGGTSDQEARLHTAKMIENTRWTIVIEYKLGAGATVGVGYVAKAAPDGYTLLSGTSSFVAAPAVYKSITYDPIRDFAPVVLMNKRASLFVVHSSVPARTFGEYVAYVKANPGKVNVGTSGLGSAPHLGGALLHDMINAEVAYVHYKGSSQMNIDLAAGRIQSNIGLLAILPLVKTGKIRVLGVTSVIRSKLMPDIPTIAEQGVPGFEYAGWSGYVVPARTPDSIVRKLNAEFVKVARSPEIIDKIVQDNGNAVGSTPEEFRQFLAEEVARWQRVAKNTGIELD